MNKQLIKSREEFFRLQYFTNNPKKVRELAKLINEKGNLEREMDDKEHLLATNKV